MKLREGVWISEAFGAPRMCEMNDTADDHASLRHEAAYQPNEYLREHRARRVYCTIDVPMNVFAKTQLLTKPRANRLYGFLPPGSLMLAMDSIHSYAKANVQSS